MKFQFLQIWKTYPFLTLGLSSGDFIELAPELCFWISERSSDSQLGGCKDCELIVSLRNFWNSCPRGEPGCGNDGSLWISSRTGSTRSADQGGEVQVWVSLLCQHQGICASLLELQAITPSTVSITLVMPPSCSSNYHGTAPSLMTFVKCFPWNVKQRSVNTWSGMRTAQQSWISSGVPFVYS